MSFKNMLHFTTWLRPTPASIKIAFIFSNTWVVSASIVSMIIWPVDGSWARRADTNTRLPATIAWLKGPTGFGASDVLTIFFISAKIAGFKLGRLNLDLTMKD